MRIEEVEALVIRTNGFPKASELFDIIDQALQSLRAEAWHPIEKAEEMGAYTKPVLVYGTDKMHDKGYFCVPSYGVEGDQYSWYSTPDGWTMNVTHFRFINPPEGS